MYRYFAGILLAVMMAGCQGESDTQQSSSSEQPPMEEPFQQEGPAANVEVSDEELGTFVDVNISFQEVQMEAQQEMVAVLEDEGLSVDKYNEISQGLQMGQSGEDLDVESGDMDKFENASETIAEIEERLDSEFEAAVNEAGMEMDRFMEINSAIQQDPDLMQRVQQLIQEEAGQQMPPAEN